MFPLFLEKVQHLFLNKMLDHLVIVYPSRDLSCSQDLSFYILAILSFLESLRSKSFGSFPVCVLSTFDSFLLCFVLGQAFSFSRCQIKTFCLWNAIPDPTMQAGSHPHRVPSTDLIIQIAVARSLTWLSPLHCQTPESEYVLLK